MGLGNVRLSRQSGGADTVNFVNLIFRVLQFLIGVVVLVMYATQPSYFQWQVQFGADRPRFGLGIAAGALAIITTPVLGVLPFFFGYKPIAFACIWDLIVMAVYAATFAYFKKLFPYGARGDFYKDYYHSVSPAKISNGRIDVMRAAITVDLVGMLLWLITLFMAFGLLLFGRLRGGKVTY